MYYIPEIVKYIALILSKKMFLLFSNSCQRFSLSKDAPQVLVHAKIIPTPIPSIDYANFDDAVYKQMQRFVIFVVDFLEFDFKFCFFFS